MCLNNTAQSSSALCAHSGIWQPEQSQAFTDPSLCACIPALMPHPFSPVPPDPLQQFVEGHRNWRPLWQAPFSPSLNSQTWMTGCKDTKSLSPLGHFQKKKKKLFQKKTSLSRKFHFSCSRALQFTLSCHSKSCSSFIWVTPYQHLDLASELR